MPINDDLNVAGVIIVAAAAYMGPEGILEIPAQHQQTGIVVGDLPTADPHQKSQLWSNAGVVTISAG